MALLTSTQALNCNAPLRYTRSRDGWFVWVEGQENTGPHGEVVMVAGTRWKARAVRCGSTGAHHGPWRGSFRNRRIAAHAALV